MKAIRKLRHVMMPSILVGILLCSPFTLGSFNRIDISLKHDLEYSMKSAFRYLVTQQQPDGSWQGHPAITGLVLSAFLRSSLPIEIIDSVAGRGFKFLMSCIKSDGSIYKDYFINYSTSIALRAFKDAKNPAFDSMIFNAENFLISLQFDENKRYTPDSLSYGGVGYGDLKPGKRPDISNLQWTLAGLHDETVAELEKNVNPAKQKHLQKKRRFYQKALVFISKCQNLKSINPESYASNDGGFMYAPGISKAGGTSSYGSMTYAGLLCMIYINVDRTDPRIQAAVNWISKHYTTTENPGMGTQGLYYYYHTMAKALNAYNKDEITDGKGNNHDWRSELAQQFIALKKPEGFWKNDEKDRWMENNEILVSSYVLLAMEEIIGEQDDYSQPVINIK